MIDYGEQVAKELENARNELYKQITSVGTKIQLLWEVVRTLIVFTVPLLAGIGFTFLSHCYLPRALAIVLSTISNGVTIGLVFLNIGPLNEAINNYVESRVYTPSFVKCSCKTCHDNNNCSHEQHGSEQDKQERITEHIRSNMSSANDDLKGVHDQSIASVDSSLTSDTTENAAVDNAKTLSQINVEPELD